jgi:guanylate kinase
MTTASSSIDAFLFVVAAASGTGKTSLVAALRERRPDLAVSVSHTTRPMRPGERDGDNYYFVERGTFETLKANGQFLESAEVFGHLYGTSLNEIDRIKASGRSTLLEIDWQGALQIKEQLPEAQLIFLLPPSLDALRTRLLGRGQDSSEVIEQRLSMSVSEISQYSAFDYLVVNDSFDLALSQLDDIISGRGGAFRRDVQEMAQGELLTELLTEAR